MKFLLFLIVFNYSLALLTFPLKIRENFARSYKSPINQTQISIKRYLYHILNHYELVSEIEVGNPPQKVELLFNFNDNFISLLSHITSSHPYFYNKSTSYQELIIKDKNCSLKVENSVTIKEILHMKNYFCSNLSEYIKSNKKVSHEFIIIFNKYLPNLKPFSIYENSDSNAINIGLLWNSKYNNDHGIYKPFLNEVKDKELIENYVHFIYFFDEYESNLYSKNKNDVYDGLLVIGKYPHELLPNKYDIKNLFFTKTFLKYSKIVDKEDILWGIKFNEVYIDYGNNQKKNFEYLRGIFDLDIEYIFPPYEYYETIKNFFRPLRKICFIDTNGKNVNKDDNNYRMVYCDYEEFGTKYLKTFPKLVFKIKDFDEEFEFTYEDLFKPVYDNKYYMFLIFTGRFWRASEYIVQTPSYPWTLGRIFFRKYQFVFDSFNKKVGYYKTKNKNIYMENKADINDSNELINNVNDNNCINENKTLNKSLNKNESSKEIKIADSIFIVVFVVVLSIILVLVAGIFYEREEGKIQRKKRKNELIDEPEYIPKEEQ